MLRCNRGSHISGGVYAQSHNRRSRTYRQAPSVYYKQRWPVLPPGQLPSSCTRSQACPAIAVQLAQVIELLRDIRDEAGAESNA